MDYALALRPKQSTYTNRTVTLEVKAYVIHAVGGRDTHDNQSLDEETTSGDKLLPSGSEAVECILI